ncbi:hypothetical protein [Aquaspirillum serpens]|uniref:hypothetical protein n=1 Tax=Aquaspirillum serpens TaxID=190 RepID=UPI0003B6E828|nr:hypothetical protein [Aquaspirillum serpens]
MDWQINAPEFGIEPFVGVQLNEILYEFDGPRIFTATSLFGTLLYFLAEEDDGISRFIVVPTNAQIVERLKSGILSVWDALNQPWIWVVDISFNGIPQKSWRCTLADVPADVLPKSGVMLWSHLEPVFALRAIGEGLSEGNVPASVIRQVIDGATTALKKIASRVFEKGRPQGRKANFIRQFYDLPAQGFAYNSFEVAFKLPDLKQLKLPDGGSADDLSEAFEEIGNQLQQAIEWALKTTLDSADTSEIDLELLEALEKLVPRQTGIVESVELRGRIFKNAHKRYPLTRESSKRVSNALRNARSTQERICQISGLIPEVDKDNFTFTLRGTDDGSEHFCSFPPELIDEVLLAFNTDKRVTVSGRETLGNGNIEVSIIL